MRDWENNIRRVVPYTPGEQPKNTCVIKLNTNENPYPPAPGVKEVLSNFNTDDLRLYPDPRVDKLVNAIADFYKIDIDKIIVIYDDIDVETGTIKIRKKGGPGTHNGAKSVVHELVSEDFPRIRVGIGKPADEYDAIDYVIGKLDEEKYKALEAGINRAADATIYYIEYGIDNAMNKFN